MFVWSLVGDQEIAMLVNAFLVVVVVVVGKTLVECIFACCRTAEQDWSPRSSQRLSSRSAYRASPDEFGKVSGVPLMRPPQKLPLESPSRPKHLIQQARHTLDQTSLKMSVIRGTSLQIKSRHWSGSSSGSFRLKPLGLQSTG
ncbi:hypothetical protein K470DRAFT_155398 [Piedraia hortae CBS 480.64]|uniref:Uncharacterized protein n=1 Tax=Piedraia hortae CBS 480.64 TaxID=1314780 RepID=A0A6A7C682_9PEZI|nr:hypothetical protein K470DRAFT_155398 [Piedraia hortae CBS 480.64]